MDSTTSIGLIQPLWFKTFWPHIWARFILNQKHPHIETFRFRVKHDHSFRGWSRLRVVKRLSSVLMCRIEGYLHFKTKWFHYNTFFTCRICPIIWPMLAPGLRGWIPNLPIQGTWTLIPCELHWFLSPFFNVFTASLHHGFPETPPLASSRRILNRKTCGSKKWDSHHGCCLRWMLGSQRATCRELLYAHSTVWDSSMCCNVAKNICQIQYFSDYFAVNIMENSVFVVCKSCPFFRKVVLQRLDLGYWIQVMRGAGFSASLCSPSTGNTPWMEGISGAKNGKTKGFSIHSKVPTFVQIARSWMVSWGLDHEVLRWNLPGNILSTWATAMTLSFSLLHNHDVTCICELVVFPRWRSSK